MQQELNEDLGSYLKRMRDERNISIEQVAYATRISLKMLRALEDNDHTALPAPTFVRGYLQAYAKYAKIDAQDLLLRYQHHLATATDPKKGNIRSHYLYVRERYQEKRRLVLVIVLFVAMLSVAGTYFLLKAKREKNKMLAQQAEQILKSTPTETSALTTTASGTSTATDVSASSSATATSSATASAVATSSKISTSTNTATASATATVATTATAISTATAKEVAKVTEPPKTEAKLTEPVAPQPVARTDEKKTYNLLLKAEEDVWIKFQTDQDETKDLTLRAGKAMMLRANSVIKIFSGNLGALKATLNGAPMNSLASGNRSKSVVLPESEASKYPLPLFPPAPVSSTEKPTSGASGQSGNPN
jgi:cytoskeleton protein RodZ